MWCYHLQISWFSRSHMIFSLPPSDPGALLFCTGENFCHLPSARSCFEPYPTPRLNHTSFQIYKAYFPVIWSSNFNNPSWNNLVSYEILQEWAKLPLDCLSWFCMVLQYCKSDQILGCNLVDSHLHWHKSLRAQQEAKTARKSNRSITIIWNYLLYFKIKHNFISHLKRWQYLMSML